MATVTQVRKTIGCCRCGNHFTLLIETAGEPELSLRCLYCAASLHINLAEYPQTVTEVMRPLGDNGPKTMTVYDLPEKLETQEC